MKKYIICRFIRGHGLCIEILCECGRKSDLMPLIRKMRDEGIVKSGESVLFAHSDGKLIKSLFVPRSKYPAAVA